jgi:hypothetical protein
MRSNVPIHTRLAVIGNIEEGPPYPVFSGIVGPVDSKNPNGTNLLIITRQRWRAGNLWRIGKTVTGGNHQ